MAISTDVLNSVNGTAAGSSTSNSTSTAQATQDRFLKLLVAQLNSQDPMNPMDNAQMTSQIAQLNTVTGIETLNATVTGMLSQLASLQTLQGATMVGRDVLVPGSRVAVADGVGRGSFDLGGAADAVKVEIRTPGGTLVDTLQMGNLAAGRQSFEWDATKYAGSETLQFKVTATNNNTAVTATALERAKVGSVSNENNTLMLQLAGRDAVAYSAVKAIL
ncbi:flagellar hook assembly protein FlgD [Pseudorhodoferax sp. Leaf267]|uniref:flagellar hook assembly protein FlgD n=1 Tax=Pseudorhodoferax sp. Leaf267 TaxID=1736316 RepID=UPI0006F73F1A|nr:flagellar hook capping FlgD N-terminal domain-containing protein [Pseudorhodoferax sp. Leaf267]KQP13753.1 flagellar biosynthesis protein FlgD [Pseudorhodoferax sp. Leaf267]